MSQCVPLDIQFVRDQFPAFHHESTRDWAFLENAGGSYVPHTVISRLQRFLVETKVQPHGPYDASKAGGQAIDEAHAHMAEMINADIDEIVIGSSTTMNVYVLANSMRSWFKPNDEIVVTNQDHEANNGAWRRLSEFGVRIREWKINPFSGELDLNSLENLLGNHTRLVCFPHCSNIVGSTNNVQEIIRRVRKTGGLTMIDGVSHAPHQAIDVKALDADFYAFSLYKTYGPHLGLLYVRRDHLQRLTSQNHEQITDGLALKLNPGGVNHEEAASLSGITEYFDSLYDHHFHVPEPRRHRRITMLFDLLSDHTNRMCFHLIRYLKTVPSVRIIGNGSESPKVRAPTVSFAVKGRSSKEIASTLATHKVAVRAGSFYAWRCTQALGIDPNDGVVRASMLHYNTMEEVERLISSLEEIL